MNFPSPQWLAAKQRAYSSEGVASVMWVLRAVQEWQAQTSLSQSEFLLLWNHIKHWFEEQTTIGKDAERPGIRSAWFLDGGFVEVWARSPVFVSRMGPHRQTFEVPGKAITGVRGLSPQQKRLLNSEPTERSRIRNWKTKLREYVASEWEAGEMHHKEWLSDSSKKWFEATAKHVHASGILLCDPRCRFMSADSSRFGLECALKLLWIHFLGYTEERFLAKNKGPGHDLAKLLKGAQPILSSPIFTTADERLKDFPEVGDRYHDPYVESERLWRCYECALLVAEEASRRVVDDVLKRPIAPES